MELSNRIKYILPSETLQVTSKAKQMKSQGIEVMNLSAGEPDFDTPVHIKEAAIKSIRDGFTKYTPPDGILALKEAICKEIFGTDGLRYEPSEVAVSCGAKHSIYNILQVLVQNGDEVLIVSPYWVSYPPMVTLSEGKAVIIKTKQNDNFSLRITDLASAINKRTNLLIINSPSNPTGVIYSNQLLEEIADLALKHKLMIISDEIYRDIVYDDSGKANSIAAINSKIKELAVIVRGVSKKYSMTGWRIGYMLGPKPLVGAVAKLQSHSTSNPTSISQMAALAALNSNQDCVTDMVAEFQKRRDYVLKRIQTIEGLSCVKPQGAFYMFCNIAKSGLDSVQFAKTLLEKEKVAVVPGKAFGEDDFIRISFATSISVLSEAFDRLERFITEILRQEEN